MSTVLLTVACTPSQHIFSMVVWGKKTWCFLPPDDVPATPHTIETGEDNERIDITPDSHPSLPWIYTVAYTGDVIFVPAFFWHCVISDAGGAPPSLLPCRPFYTPYPSCSCQVMHVQLQDASCCNSRAQTCQYRLQRAACRMALVLPQLAARANHPTPNLSACTIQAQ